MAFFVIGRDRTDGLLRLLDGNVHDTREAAARAVRSLAMAGTIAVDDIDVYISDLSVAVPVVVVGVPAEPTIEKVPGAEEVVGVDEVAAGAWEAPGSAVVHDIPPAEVDDVVLADALMRAASRLESEGIATPESVGFEVALYAEGGLLADPAVVALVPEEPEDTVDADLSAVIASLGALDDSPPVLEQTPPEEPTGEVEGWPWLNVADVAAEEPSEETVEAAAERAAEATAETPLLDSAAPVSAEVAEVSVFDDSDSLIAAPVIDDDFAVAPVIMGDYPHITPHVSETVVVATPEPEPHEDAGPVLVSDASAPLREVAEPASAYEPAGDLALEIYTCADCVYSNTCPKVDQTTPAECGAFQWKAV